jgi:precorrin-2/cobalt-factor-2 C20-methyltransferase
MTGTLYGVGVGPGDPELMTLKAVKTIRQSAVIAVPRTGGSDMVALGIAARAAPGLETKRILEVDMPMTKDQETLRACHEKAAGQIVEILKQGENVSFLTLGDPSIYSTYIYVHRIVRKKGYTAELIPGVPSFCAASAKLGDSLADASQPLHILPGSYGNLREGLALRGTKVLMKSGKAFEEVKAELAAAGLLSCARMAVNCGMENERILETMDDAADASGYFTIIVVKDNV